MTTKLILLLTLLVGSGQVPGTQDKADALGDPTEQEGDGAFIPYRADFQRRTLSIEGIPVAVAFTSGGGRCYALPAFGVHSIEIDRQGILEVRLVDYLRSEDGHREIANKLGVEPQSLVEVRVDSTSGTVAYNDAGSQQSSALHPPVSVGHNGPWVVLRLPLGETEQQLWTTTPMRYKWVEIRHTFRGTKTNDQIIAEFEAVANACIAAVNQVTSEPGHGATSASDILFLAAADNEAQAKEYMKDFMSSAVDIRIHTRDGAVVDQSLLADVIAAVLPKLSAGDKLKDTIDGGERIAMMTEKNFGVVGTIDSITKATQSETLENESSRDHSESESGESSSDQTRSQTDKSDVLKRDPVAAALTS